MKSFHHLLLLIVFLVLLSCPVPAGTTSTVYDQDKTILVDLSHAERVMVDGAVAPDLDRSQNNRVLNWQDWANDMRGQGYDVRTLTDGPVTAEKLAGTCLFIIAEPDMGKNGIAYFTADEAKAIAEYVDSGHALLLMGHTFLGGQDKQSYRQDYTSNSMYALIQNDLLKKMKVNMKFTADSASRPIGDIMVDPDSTDMVQASMSDIWVHEGDTSHEVWKDVPEGRFAYFHGSSIDLPPKGGIAYGDAAAFTTRDTTSVLFQDPFAGNKAGESVFLKRVESVATSAGVFGLIVKDQGSYPVAIAETPYGCGIIMLYGDSAAWQNSAYWGSVYTNEAFHERKLAYNMVTYLTKHCEDCVTPAPTAAKAKTAPTKVILTPKAGVTVKNTGTEKCTTCIDKCLSQTPGGYDLDICIEKCGVSGLQSSQDGIKYCPYCYNKFPNSNADYARCIKDDNCRCPSSSSSGGASSSTKDQRPTATVTPTKTPTGVVINPGGKVVTAPNGDCGSCIQTCNEKTVDGVSLTDTELKQCYTSCGSGLCDNTWTSCGGAGGFTVTGPAGIVSANANPRATETPVLGAILSTSANPRATVTPDTGVPSKFSKCTGYEDGQFGSYYCSDCNACISYRAKGYQCGCEKDTEGSNPQTVVTADFTPGLRECYLSSMKGSSCSCPAPTPASRPTARVLDIPQMTLVITKTPTVTPQSRPTGRVLPIPQQTIILNKTPTSTPTAASLIAKAPAICNECRDTCKGKVGSKYTTCLGDCAEQKGQVRSACLPKMTLPPTTPQKMTVADYSAYGSGNSGTAASTDPGTGSGGTTPPDNPPVHIPICFETCIPGACHWEGLDEFKYEVCDPPVCFTTCI